MVVIFLRFEEIILRVISRIVYPVSLAREGTQIASIPCLVLCCVPSLAKDNGCAKGIHALIPSRDTSLYPLLSSLLCPFPCKR